MASISESPVPAVRPINLNYAASDREVSIRILEYTAVAITTLMFLWLLIWFRFHPPRFTDIRAFYLELDSSELPLVLFQESDAAEIAKYDQGKDKDKEPRKAERLNAGDGLRTLKASLNKVVAEDKKPCIIYLSAPAFGHGPGTTIGKHEPGPKTTSSKNELVELIGELAKEAKRPVLLAIDAAQVSSSREFSIFANDPYQGLSEALNEIKTPNNVPFLVLTSCGPAQTSELRAKSGGTLFALVLEQALKQQSSNPSERINFEELGTRVAMTVDKLTGKRQTPQLITIGKKETQPPQISLKATSPSEISEETQNTIKHLAAGRLLQNTTVQKVEQANVKAKSESQKGKPDESTPESPKIDPRELIKNEIQAQRLKLDEIWRTFRDKHNPDVAPFRFGFVAWRKAEDALIKAERFLLQVKLSPNPSGEAFSRLDDKINEAAAAVDAVRQERKGNLLFQPIRPDGGQDEPAATELVAWLAEVTVKKESDIRGKLFLNLSSAAQGEVQQGNAAGSEKKRLPSVSVTAENYRNGIFDKRPERMLAIWGQLFRDGLEKKFVGPKPSWDLNRLVEATEIRFDAEAALALAEQWGGEVAIQNLVSDGDVARRQVEDLAFAPTGVDPSDWKKLNEKAKDFYEKALKLARTRRKAITEADQALLDLPNYASSIIEARSKVENNSSNGAGEYPFFPGTLSEPLDNIKNLVDGLAEPEKSTPEELSKVVERLHESPEGAKKVTVDDPLLRLNMPGIDHDERTGLYNELKYSSLPDVYDSRGELKEPKPAHDLSHLGRAIGLARLELELTKASLTEKVEPKVQAEINALEVLVKSSEDEWRKDKKSIDLGRFAMVEQAVVKLRTELRKQLTDSKSGMKIAVNPILAWPHFAVRNWGVDEQKALAQALKPDREKLGKFQADRLIKDRGDGPLPVKIKVSQKLKDSKPVDVQVEYGSDAKAPDIAAPGAGTSTILVLGIPKNSAQSNPPMQPSPQPTPEGDSILAKPVRRGQSPILLPDTLARDLIPAGQPQTVDFKVTLKEMPENPTLLAAAFHRGLWVDSDKKELTPSTISEYDVKFTLSKDLLEKYYQPKVDSKILDDVVKEILRRFDLRHENKGYARHHRPFLGAFVVTRNLEGVENVYIQIEVTPPGPESKSFFLSDPPVPHTFSKKGKPETIDFTLEDTQLFLGKDTKVKLIISPNADVSKPIQLKQSVFLVQAVEASPMLEFDAKASGNLSKDVSSLKLKNGAEKYKNYPASILVVKRKAEDKVVEPIIVGDIKVAASYVLDNGEIETKTLDLIEENKTYKESNYLLWPDSKVDLYLYNENEPKYFYSVEWGMTKCVGDEKDKEQKFFLSDKTEKVDSTQSP